MHPNKTVSNEVKDNEALLEPSYRKKPKERVGQPSISSGDRHNKLTLSHKQVSVGLCYSQGRSLQYTPTLYEQVTWSPKGWVLEANEVLPAPHSPWPLCV